MENELQNQTLEHYLRIYQSKNKTTLTYCQKLIHTQQTHCMQDRPSL